MSKPDFLYVAGKSMRFPVKLKSDPLIDRVFEIRFKPNLSASTILPGALYGSLNGTKQLERLPMSDIPAPIRESDPSFRFSALTRLMWDRFAVMIGDRMLAVGAVPPYPGWSVFKPAIAKVLEVVSATKLGGKLERYSFKSVNLFPNALGTAKQLVEIELRIGPRDATEDLFQVRNEFRESGIIDVIQISSRTTVTNAEGAVKQGMLLDIDSIVQLETSTDLESFLVENEAAVDKLHAHNNRRFFECLTKEAIAKLDPVYE